MEERGGVVIGQYISVAMRRTHYEMLENDEGFYSSIPELAGVWAQAQTLEECREELKSALEDCCSLVSPDNIPFR